MTVLEMLLIVTGGALLNVCAIERMGGAKIARFGLNAAAVAALTAACAWPVQTYLLEPFGLGRLCALVCAVLAGAATYALKVESRLRTLTLLNGAALSLCVSGQGWMQTLVAALVAGLALLAAIIVLERLDRRIEHGRVPKAFQGLTIRLAAVSIASMALYALR